MTNFADRSAPRAAPRGARAAAMAHAASHRDVPSAPGGRVSAFNPIAGRRFDRPGRRAACAMLRAVAVALVVSFPAGAAAAGAAPPAVAGRPRNVIFMIGDGFGPAYVALAREVAGRPLALDPHLVGSSATASSDARVTDSGAAATALACGVQAPNLAIGVCAGGLPRRSILEAAEARGLATGLVATSRITHATPAAFAAHVPKREAEDDIAAQMVRQGIEVVLGGGARHFRPYAAGGRRDDGRDLLAEARRRGIEVVADRDGLARAGRGPLLGLFADSHMSYAFERDAAREPSLVEMTEAALARLAVDPDGFFLMVEGSRIDHAGHVHDAAAAAREAIEFDEAFAASLAFARRDGRTLVVVTADHETGGLSLGRALDGRAVYDWRPGVLRGVRRSATAMAERVGRGDDPRVVLAEDAGLADLSDEEAAGIRAAAGESRVLAIAEAVNRRALVAWTTTGHTGVDVPVWAFGPGAERFAGTRRIDELGRAVAAALGLSIGDVLETAAAPAGGAAPRREP
uniref:Alkaline phosphatase n=1 Tax=Eiseniibacteriota bacterium TaxID=2212470 RepID=A0A832MII9_UNCEI